MNMNSARKLIIRSNDNEDWNGTWTKSEVIQEMLDLGCSNADTQNGGWIEWILGHMFECSLGPGMEDAIAHNGSLQKVDLILDDGEVTVIKC